jgi:hypothetical protein
VRFFSQYYKPALAILIGLAIFGGVTSLVTYYRNRPAKKAAEPGARRSPKVA